MLSLLTPHLVQGRDILPETYAGGVHFTKEDFAGSQRSPLGKTYCDITTANWLRVIARALFGVEGVQSVFLAKDFLSVMKTAQMPWHVLKPVIFSTVLDFFSGSRPVIEDKPTLTDTTVTESDSEVVALIKELLETRIRPSVQDDGGDIFYEGFEPDTGMVRLRLAGSCVGCPSSSVTLRNGVENMLMHYIPEVKGIIEVGQEQDKDASKLEFKPEPV